MKPKTTSQIERERLVNAAHRFAKISKRDSAKLFRLLYRFDIRLFRETGKSCTGENYYALADGPAPGTLRSLLVMRNLDIDAAIGVLTSTDSIGPWPFCQRAFFSRELEIMSELETNYRESTSLDITLDDNNAWWHVYNDKRGVGSIIPYQMTLGYLASAPEKALKSKNLIANLIHLLQPSEMQSMPKQGFCCINGCVFHAI